MKHLEHLLLFLCSLICIESSSQTPILNSYPSASGTIFLDFDGQTVSGTIWYQGGTIVCAPSGLNESQIVEVFNRVSEDYRPFSLNITTDSTKYWAAPVNKRVRVIVTTTYEWYGQVGGTSIVNSFSSGDNTPSFVFSGLLGYNCKKVSEACAHEAGHTLGLYHQASYDANCNKISDYSYGTGSGEIGWAPIMGVGYNQNMTLWNSGPNPFGCTSIQNDLDIIINNNSLSYRPDDFGATFPTAALQTFTNNQFIVNGLIEKNGDKDMFKFVMPANNRFQLNASPFNVGNSNAGSDLDIQVSLYNNAQTLIGTYNPSTLLNASIDTTLNAGNYYLKVEGKGNQYAPNYASLGSYILQGTYAGIILPLHKLELTGKLVNNQHKLNWEIIADEQLINQQLEVSDDGINFTPLVSPSTVDRNYSYQPYYSTSLQYRLHVTFDNGQGYYSNIVTINPAKAMAKPRLVNTIISNNNLTVSSPETYQYSVYETSGRILAKGLLQKGINTITLGNLPGGMYIIRFNNETQQWSDKFVVQQ